MISQLNTKASLQVSKLILIVNNRIETEIGREALDNKSKSNPLEAGHSIVDGRAERVIFESG